LSVKGDFVVAGNQVTRLDNASWSAAGFAVGQLVRIGAAATTFSVVGFAGPNDRTLVLGSAPATQGAVSGTVSVIDPKTGVARIGGDTLVVTGDVTTTAAGGPTSPLVLYGDTSQ